MAADRYLEPAAQRFADATSQPPYLFELSPGGARAALDRMQTTDVDLPAVDEEWITVPAEVGDVRVRIVRPAGTTGPLPGALYLHGGGWMLGSASTHDRLVRELAVGASAAILFVDYDRTPEARYPVALEQAHAVARWVTDRAADHALDPARLAIAGDSAGGNLAAALTLLAKERGDVSFCHQSLYYPVTDAAEDTASYGEYAEGPWLRARAMAWFWHAYLPEPEARHQVTVSPLRATSEDLAGLPEAFVVVGEHDVLRDEGEAYARRLAAAGVRTTSVRYNGTFHDFMMLNPVRRTAAATAAVEQAIDVLDKALWTRRIP